MWSNKRKLILSIFVVMLGVISSFKVFSQSQSYSYTTADRDPLVPLVSKSGLILIPREMDFTGLSLKGIIYSEQGAVAVINDVVLKEGDSLGDYTVLKIEEKKVILKKGNEGFTLKLEGQ
tara:strand:- start:1763 stop:2122 length:360 start_codon:yes stop_codon:yes gene_type:complete